RQRLTVEPELLDLRGTPEVLQLGVDDLVGKVAAQLLARLLEARRLAGSAVLDLDHMPAELGLDRRLAVLTRRQGKSGVGKLLDHVVMAEIAEIAARLSGGV